uniref:Uncharacterized protein n=1 Tax=Equus caballus TaxID=9796 RepID=A0A9L0RBW5_HORSE
MIPVSRQTFLEFCRPVPRTFLCITHGLLTSEKTTFGLPEQCVKPATYLMAYLSSGIMKALAEMAFQKYEKLKFYLFTLDIMIIYKRLR